MITFKISDIHKDPEGVKLQDLHEIYINIEGKLSVYLHDKLYFSESICIVEFAVALNDWLKSSCDSSFKYESMDDDDPDTFDIDVMPNGMYSFKSSWQECESKEKFEKEKVLSFIYSYTTQVKAKVAEQFNINLGEWVGL